MGPFLKTIIPSSFGYDDSIASLVDVHSSGMDSAWMAKRASAGVFKDLQLQPSSQHSYLHLIAMGDQEYYGHNRNGDGFLKTSRYIDIPNPYDGKTDKVLIHQGNVETYPTFLSKAAVYRHHVNKDPNKREGDVVGAAHNDEMNRVELMIKVPNDKWADDIEKIASGKDVCFSMSCKIPYDVCSNCGHKAAARSEYCECLTDHLGKLTKDGTHVGMVNDNMVFFDISQVTTGADRIAFGLMKAASAGGPVVSGAELSDSLVLFPPTSSSDGSSKLAVVNKLADIEKEIEAVADGGCTLGLDPDIHSNLADDDIAALRVPRSQIPDLLGSLADMKIVLSLKDFLRIVMGDKFDHVAPHVDEAESLVPGIFSRIAARPSAMLSDISDVELGSSMIPRCVRDRICQLADTHSLDDEPMRGRAIVTIIRGKKPCSIRKKVIVMGKRASTVAVDKIATVYAMYKVAACQRMSTDSTELLRRVVMQGYVE